MEFIITGLFIIFFSYILLYSLYDILFKRSTIEGLENGVKQDDKEGDKEGDKEEDKDKKDSKSDIEIAEEGSSMSSGADDKIKKGNENSPNATLENGMKIANNKDP